MKPISSVLDWFELSGLTLSTWILAGKGPSMNRRDEAKDILEAGPVLGLNHVCQVLPCAVTHFSDIEAYRQCQDVLAKQTGMVVMPWRPHYFNRPGLDTLAHLVKTETPIGDLYRAGRLLSYNSTLCPASKSKSSLPTISVRYFSAVVGLNILARSGIKVVKTIGIDGGRSYAKDFSKDTLLVNGRSSFDVQFLEIRKTAERYEMDVQPLIGDE